jgi:hypothetical protein
VTPIEPAMLHTLTVPTWSGTGIVELFIYLVTRWRGEPRNLLPEEHETVAWFAVEQACGLQLAHPGYPALFRQAEIVASARLRETLGPLVPFSGLLHVSFSQFLEVFGMLPGVDGAECHVRDGRDSAYCDLRGVPILIQGD